jgi:hypothetical protein
VADFLFFFVGSGRLMSGDAAKGHDQTHEQRRD